MEFIPTNDLDALLCENFEKNEPEDLQSVLESISSASSCNQIKGRKRSFTSLLSKYSKEEIQPKTENGGLVTLFLYPTGKGTFFKDIF